MKCEDCGRAVAYGIYILGGSLAVGLVRLIIAVAYLAKHAFYQERCAESQHSVSLNYLKKDWSEQVARGLYELIPFYGGISYLIYDRHDFYIRATIGFIEQKDTWAFEWHFLVKNLHDEDKLDDKLRQEIPGYNPLF